MLRIRIGSVQILGRPEDIGGKPTGLFVKRGGFKGWDDSGGARRDSTPRPTAHGEFDEQTYQGAGIVSVDGWALATSEQQLGHLRSVVTGLGADGQLVRWVVDHQGETLWADARRGDKSTFDDAGIRHGLLRASFLIQFVRPDPCKYGKQRVSGPATSVTVNHFGNFPAAPVIDVTGSMPSGYTINGPDGKQFVVTQALAAGQTHRIDMTTGRLFLNGALTVRGVGRAQTWTVPPGQEVAMSLVPVSGSGSMTVTVLDTFI